MTNPKHNQLPFLIDAAVTAYQSGEKELGNEMRAREAFVQYRLDFGARCNEAKEVAGRGGWTAVREELQERTGLGETQILQAMFLANSRTSGNLDAADIVEWGGLDAAYDRLKAQEDREKAKAAADKAREKGDEERVQKAEQAVEKAKRKEELVTAPPEEREEVKKRHKKEDEEKRTAERLADPPEDDGSIWHGSIAKYRKQVKRDSLDAIFTDPPYPRQYLPVWQDLARFAARNLKPGGLLLAITGHLILPDILDRLREETELVYRWTGALVWRKSRTNIHAAKVSNGWKPFVAFQRTGGHPDFYSEDTYQAGAYTPQTQADHEWGQDQALMNDVAKEWLRPGWKVCDPFVGAGSLLVAAKSRGCFVTGCDIEEGHVLTTREKLASIEEDLEWQD